MISINRWFTLNEVLAVYPAYKPTPNATNETNWFLSMLSTASLTLRYVGISLNGSTIKEADVKGFINDLMNVVFDRQHDNYLYKLELRPNEVHETLTEDDFKKAINKVINVLNLTMPKYIPILYQYQKNYEKAFKQLESTSDNFTRFNDTPQNEMDEVDYNTEPYATNMGRSKSYSLADSGSVPAKLKELQDNMRATILDWSNEFDPIFIDEYQLEVF